MAFPSSLPSLSSHLVDQPWQTSVNEPVSAPAITSDWLIATESLTERLSAVAREFAVHVVQQAPLPLHASERAMLPDTQLPESENDTYTVREVVLHDAGQAWVFARSVIPQSMCQGDFVGLGNQPLGKILFNDPRFQRQPFAITCIPQDSAFASAWHAPFALWGRRSLFRFDAKYILVSEVFLPASPAYGAHLACD